MPNNQPTWADTPLTRGAAPRASDLATRIAALLESVIDLAGDVQAYGNKWCGGTMGELATKLREATREYDSI
jgi:hypothetical protein